MNKTVELLNEWAAYEAKHPGAGIDDFCRFRLQKVQADKQKGALFNGLVPPHEKSVLSKLLVRLSKLINNYNELALKGLNIKQMDDFKLLTTIADLKNPRKTEVIYYDIMELSTGLLILERLKKQGYITEKADETDKRSKRLYITRKGEKVLRECYACLWNVSEMLYQDMQPEDVGRVIKLLQDIDIKFSTLFHKQKTSTFPEIFESVTGRKYVKPDLDAIKG